MKCFFKTCLPRTEAALDGFTKLRYTDQLAIKVHLGSLDGETRSEMKTPKSPNFSIEYTKNRLDSCVACDQKFMTREIRVVNNVYDMNQNEKPMSYHALCFAGIRYKLGWLQSAESFAGFDRLSDEDKDVVTSQIP